MQFDEEKQKYMKALQLHFWQEGKDVIVNSDSMHATIKFHGEVLMELFRLVPAQSTPEQRWMSYAVARMGTCIRVDSAITDDAIIEKAQNAFRKHVEGGSNMDAAFNEMNELVQASINNMMDLAKALEASPYHSHELDILKAVSGSRTDHELPPNINRFGQVGNALFAATVFK